jgi:transposase
MAMIGAAMHKLLRQVFGVLKPGQPFDPNFLALPS